MIVGKTIDHAMKQNAPSYARRKIILPPAFHEVAEKIAGQYLRIVKRQICVRKKINNPDFIL